jgi:hypothetical protein
MYRQGGPLFAPDQASALDNLTDAQVADIRALLRLLNNNDLNVRLMDEESYVCFSARGIFFNAEGDLVIWHPR